MSPFVVIFFFTILVYPERLIVAEIAGPFHIVQLFGKKLFGGALVLGIVNGLEPRQDVPLGAVAAIAVSTDIAFTEIEELYFTAEPLRFFILCHW